MPYVRHMPARLTMTTVDARGDTVVETHESQGKDQFALEWADFHDTVSRQARPANTLDDARADLEIAIALVQALKACEDGVGHKI
jgi:predicted dehydrogenase